MAERKKKRLQMIWAEVAVKRVRKDWKKEGEEGMDGRKVVTRVLN